MTTATPHRVPAPPAAAVRRWGPPLGAAGAGVVATMVWSLAFAFHARHLVWWRTPVDIWATLRGAHLVAWGDLGGVYGGGTSLVSFPGSVLLLVPVALVSSALGMSESFPLTLPHPSAWLVLGPYAAAAASLAIFGADAVARRLGVGPGRRSALAAAGAVALFPVYAVWGHPEDAVAVGLLLYAVLAALDGRHARAGWLAGAAVAVQPLVLLGLPVLVALTSWRRWPGLAARAALPAAVLVAVCLAGDAHATIRALLEQPNFPRIDRVTPWTALAPRLGGAGQALAVAAGPGRLVALAGAIGVGAVLRMRLARRRRVPAAACPDAGVQRGRAAVLALAVALSLRCLTESVMDPFYLWPALGVGLLASAAVGGRHLAAASAAAVATTVLGELHPVWWLWWYGVTAGMVLSVCCGIAVRPRFWRSSSALEMPLAHQEADRPGLAPSPRGG